VFSLLFYGSATVPDALERACWAGAFFRTRGSRCCLAGALVTVTLLAGLLVIAFLAIFFAILLPVAFLATALCLAHLLR
jgi:hypothetical protein